MEFVCRLQLTEYYQSQTNWTAETESLVASHFQYLKSLFENGIVSYIGKTELDIANKENFGIYFFEAETLGKAISISQNDPIVKANVMQASCLPFRTVLKK
jgi:uncharacterized protein YciI